MECKDRGVLLERINRGYKSLFNRVPGLVSQLQAETYNLQETNKNYRTTLEKLMKDKTTAGILGRLYLIITQRWNF